MDKLLEIVYYRKVHLLFFRTHDYFPSSSIIEEVHLLFFRTHDYFSSIPPCMVDHDSQP
jgi:hypothetical protein